MRINQLVLLITLLILLISSSACVRLREIPKDAPPLMTPEEYKNFVAKYDTTAAKLASQRQRESKTASTLTSSGLPVSSVFTQLDDGGQVLVIVLDYSKLSVGSSDGAFITAAVQSLVKIAGIKTLDLSGITYVTVGLKDKNGKVFIEAGVKAADVDAFRTGKMTQTQLIKKTAAKVIDRFAAWGAKK